MTATLRRLAIITAFAIPVYLLLTTGLTMIVNPPRGGSEVSAAQQAAYAQQDLVMAERAFDANVVQFNAWHHCASVKDWKREHPHGIPVKMVEHMDGSGVLNIVPWTYPAARGQWVVGFCS